MYSNADTYFGQYSNDRRQGVGFYLVAKGGGYAGSYDGSKREGQGIMRMPDGALYQGQFAGDKFEGQGQYEYIDGSTYIGAWKGGKKHGEVNKTSTCHAACITCIAMQCLCVFSGNMVYRRQIGLPGMTDMQPFAFCCEICS